MTIQYINTGSSANAGNGDSLRSAFIKVNSNFNYLSTASFGGGNGYTGSRGSTGTNGYTGSAGINGYTGSQGPTGNINDLSDVTIQSPQSNDYLKYVGGTWTNSQLAIVDDLSPKLSNNLDTNGFTIQSNLTGTFIVLRSTATGISLQGPVIMGSASQNIDGSLYIIRNAYSTPAVLDQSVTFAQHHNTSDAVNFNLYRTRGTSTSILAVQNGDDLADIAFIGHDGTNALGAASITVSVDGAVSTGIVPGLVSFNLLGADGIARKQAELNSSGTWKINKLSHLSTTTSSIVVSTNLIPSADLTHDLGSTSSQWRSLYVGASTIYIGGAAVSVAGGNLTINGNPVSASTATGYTGSASTATGYTGSASTATGYTGSASTATGYTGSVGTTGYTGSSGGAGSATTSTLVNGTSTVSLSSTGTLTIPGSLTLPNGAVIRDTAGDAIAFGQGAGETTQGNSAVAIGENAGKTTQGESSVAVGRIAGQISQGSSATAVGYGAGYENQGLVAVAIGALAGASNQAANTIILNATGVSVNGVADQTDSFYVDPVRTDATPANVLYYNTTTKEVTYGAGGGGGVSSLVNGTSTVSLSTSGSLTLPAGGTIAEGGGLTGAIRLTPAGGANAYQALVIYPTAAAPDGDHLHLTAGGGTTELYLGDDSRYVKLVNGGNVEIRATTTSSSASAAWTFGTNGAISTTDPLIINVPNGVPTGVGAIASTGGSWEQNPAANLATTGGTGTGLRVSVTHSGGYASAIAITVAGTGYLDGELITVTSGGSSASFIIAVTGTINWTFGTNGSLTFPNATVQTTAWTGIPGPYANDAAAAAANVAVGNPYHKTGTSGQVFVRLT